MPATYRYEISSTNRAVCQNSACKKEAIKIQKGELRFGSLVEINEHSSWKWKHWGCVTPRQIATIIDQIGGLDGLDLDSDLDILDGYEELEDWAKEKIKYALQNGHVHDDDWKGEPELNRPGMKGINKRKKKAEDDDQTGTDATPAKPRRGRKKKKTTADDDEETEASPVSKSKRKSTAAKKRKVEEDDEVEAEPPKKKRVAKNKKAAIKDEELDSDEPLNDAPKKMKTKTKKPNGTSAAQAQNPAVPEEPKPRKGRVRKPKVEQAKDKERQVKEEEDEEVPLPKPTKYSRSKKIKAEATTDITPEAEVPTKKASKKRNKSAKAG